MKPTSKQAAALLRRIGAVRSLDRLARRTQRALGSLGGKDGLKRIDHWLKTGQDRPA